MAEEYVVLDMDGTLYCRMHESMAVTEMAKRLYAYTDSFGIPREEVSGIVNRDIRYLRISSLVYRLSKKCALDAIDFVNYAYDVQPSAFGIRRNPRLASLLRRLGETRRIVLFTNSPIIWVDRVLGTLGLQGIMDREDMISFETLGNGRHLKPDPDAFRILLKRTGKDRKNVLLLEDTYSNVMEARKMRIRTVHVFNTDGSCSGEKKDIYAALGGLLEEYKGQRT